MDMDNGHRDIVIVIGSIAWFYSIYNHYEECIPTFSCYGHVIEWKLLSRYVIGSITIEKQDSELGPEWNEGPSVAILYDVW